MSHITVYHCPGDRGQSSHFFLESASSKVCFLGRLEQRGKRLRHSNLHHRHSSNLERRSLLGALELRKRSRDFLEARFFRKGRFLRRHVR